MIPVDFNQTVEEQLEKCQSVLVNKREEYVMGTNDVLHNFKRAAHLMDCEVRQALGGMMVKHTFSIFDMIEAERTYDTATWDEKITDSINYLLLLKAVLVDERDGDHPQDVIAERQAILEELDDDEDPPTPAGITRLDLTQEHPST